MPIVQQNYFPSDNFNCYFEEGTQAPLVVTPKKSVNLISWANENQQEIAKAIGQFGAVVFNGFEIDKNIEGFHKAFTAITGMPPQKYKGDVPRDELGANIYKSTAVANAHAIPPHQEVAGGYIENKPLYISFFCKKAPTPNSGRTEVVRVKEVTKKIKEMMPEFWEKLRKTKLDYEMTYLPSDSCRSRWIRWLNPSHATIEKRFGTTNKEEIAKQCKEEGLICEWDGEWCKVTRKGVPGIIEVDGEELFCNAIHLDKFNPALVGNRCMTFLAYILYFFAWVILTYWSSRSMQFNVKFEDGTEISPCDASKLLTILQESQEGRDWQDGDLMVIRNDIMMHAKTPHEGERELAVAMAGQ